MERMEIPKYIFKEYASRIGGGESTKLVIVTNVATGETRAEVEHTIVERYPIQDIETAIRLYEELCSGNGRYMMSLEQIAGFNPNRK